MQAQGPHIHRVQIYYEDTDLSGAVYHANYFKYFERAREHLLGVDALVDLLKTHGIGFVVYKASCTYKESAHLGDSLEIRTTGRLESDVRAVFQQDVYRTGQATPLVLGEIHLVCVDQQENLVPLPKIVVDGLKARFPEG